MVRKGNMKIQNTVQILPKTVSSIICLKWIKKKGLRKYCDKYKFIN